MQLDMYLYHLVLKLTIKREGVESEIHNWLDNNYIYIYIYIYRYILHPFEVMTKTIEDGK